VWTALDGVTFAAGAETALVQGGHVGEPVPLTDELVIDAPHRFRLVGRIVKVPDHEATPGSRLNCKHHGCEEQG
jgi:hypothetical protein